MIRSSTSSLILIMSVPILEASYIYTDLYRRGVLVSHELILPYCKSIACKTRGEQQTLWLPELVATLVDLSAHVQDARHVLPCVS